MKSGSIPRTADGESSVCVEIVSDRPGILDVPALPSTAIVIHAGKSVRTICTRGNRRFAGISVHGDIDIIPAGMFSRWEVSDSFTALVLGIPQDLLRAAGRESGVDADRLEILNRFHVRDSRMEHVGWALKAECEAGYPNGRLFTDSLGVGLAVSLLTHHVRFRERCVTRINSGFLLGQDAADGSSAYFKAPRDLGFADVLLE
jgi:AraC family transcriptional regulator